MTQPREVGAAVEYQILAFRQRAHTGQDGPWALPPISWRAALVMFAASAALAREHEYEVAMTAAHPGPERQALITVKSLNEANRSITKKLDLCKQLNPNPR